jgi:hypothetical protein
LAVTLEPEVLLIPVEGVHIYVLAPLAVNVVGLPAQIVTFGTETTGIGFTVTTTVELPEQPAADVPTTV